MVLVDSSVLSLVLRRKPKVLLDSFQRRVVERFLVLADLDEVAIIGIVRQELLSGVRSIEQFQRLQADLSGYSMIPTAVEDHDRAAQAWNLCKSHGISPQIADILLCAVAIRHRFPILTTDADFRRYAKVLPIVLDEHF